MEYIVLLRKVNVGKDNRMGKKELENAITKLGYDKVQVYINSGNIIINTKKVKTEISEEIDKALVNLFGSNIQFIIKTKKEMKDIRKAIPDEWQNDNTQKTDIAYLFPEIDKPTIINELLVKKEYINVIYIKGALIMNVSRENKFKSQYSKIIGSMIYKHMTIRNVNTARYLADSD